jgi:putative serine/threonine protein kinase
MAAKPQVVPVGKTAEKPYSLVLAYPSSDESSLRTRIRQLEELRVEALVFEGPFKLDGLSILGKGVAGMVTVGLIAGRRVALKIRRVDSRRRDMIREAEMLQVANRAGIGPRFVGFTTDVLAMELVEGERLPVWLSGLKGKGRKNRVKSVVGALLAQCRGLDLAGLDHGELSRAHKNVLVTQGDGAWILDFESASFSRRPRNLTSLAQYLFLGGILARRVGRVLGPVDRSGLLKLLRTYKEGDGTAYDSIVRFLHLV